MLSSPKDPLLGRTIAQRYRLISRLGSGASASVYLARHVLIDRLSAIKIVHPVLARDSVWRERFLREARAVNRINHPNIVEITDLGEADGLLYLVMEYVPGESLKQVLERGPVGWRRAAEIGFQVAAALGRAHQMGVVHRGLDPSNVLVVQRRDGLDSVKLTDFGVAKLSDAAPLTMRVPPVPGVSNLRDLDARSDLFALGEVLYEATSGTAPGGAPASLVDAPAFFVEVVSTLLAKNPDDRPRDGFEAADLLRRALEQDAALPSAPGPSAAAPASWRALLDASTPFQADVRRTSSPPIAPSEPPSGPASAPFLGAGVRGAGVDRLATICGAALALIEERVGAAPKLDEASQAALGDARRLSTTVAILSELTTSDTRTLDAVRARGRTERADLGKRLDEVAREHSRTLGWAGTIAERSYVVEAQRLSGEHPVPAMEAMVWEQAALEQEEDSARERAARLAADMAARQADIERHHVRHEHELEVVNACLEGRVAALRAISAEAWAALLTAAGAVGMTEAELAGGDQLL
jgi:serine/threonine-protein kinase